MSDPQTPMTAWSLKNEEEEEERKKDTTLPQAP